MKLVMSANFDALASQPLAHTSPAPIPSMCLLFWDLRCPSWTARRSRYTEMAASLRQKGELDRAIRTMERAVGMASKARCFFRSFGAESLMCIATNVTGAWPWPRLVCHQ